MDLFIKTNKEKHIWMGFHNTHGWVILDRNIKANESGGNYFIKCSDWTVYKEEGNWEKPNYNYVIPHLNSLEKDKLEDIENDATSKLNHYLNKKTDMQFELINFIHNNYLKEKGLPPRSIVKTTKKSNRESVCWECRNTVDNSYDAECDACGWIICSNCGACKQFGCK